MKMEISIKQLLDYRHQHKPVTLDILNELSANLDGTSVSIVPFLSDGARQLLTPPRFKLLDRLQHHLGKDYGDDTPISIATIIDINGLDDALWCLRLINGYEREKRLFAVWCIRQVQHLLADKRSLRALDVIEQYANGQADQNELAAAKAVAKVAASEALEAFNDARYDVRFFYFASSLYASYDAARAVEFAADSSASKAAYCVTGISEDAAAGSWWIVVRAVKRAITHAAQAAELRRVCDYINAGVDPYPCIATETAA